MLAGMKIRKSQSVNELLCGLGPANLGCQKPPTPVTAVEMNELQMISKGKVMANAQHWPIQYVHCLNTHTHIYIYIFIRVYIYIHTYIYI